jgi:hypothetical protein
MLIVSPYIAALRGADFTREVSHTGAQAGYG